MPLLSTSLRPGVHLLACLSLLVLLLPAVASAQPKVAVDAPLLGLARSGAYTPIHVDIQTQQPIEGVISVDFGNEAGVVVRPFKVGRSSSRRVTVPVAMPDWYGEIKVTVTEGRRKVIGTKVLGGTSPSSGTDELHIVAIGEDPLGLTLLRQVTGQPIIGHAGCAELRNVRVETLLSKALPNIWFGWTSVDLVVWRRPEPSELSPEQLSALRGWVLSGGTLVVGLGDNWASWGHSSLGTMSGATVRGGAASHDALVDVMRLSRAVPPAELAAAELPTVELTPTSGHRMFGSYESPLALENAVGAGRVVTLAFDPAAGELRGALDREEFWRSLLGLPREGLPDTDGLRVHRPRNEDRCGPAQEYAHSLLIHSGANQPAAGSATNRLDEWRSSVHGALSSFARANPLPLGTVLLFGFVYLLLIGPVDYFVTRKVGRPMLTWLTFPAMAIGFSVVAAGVISFQKSGDTELRCVEVVDLFGDDLRGSGWCSMWSSRRQDVQIPVPRGTGVVSAGGGASDGYSPVDRLQADALIEPTRVGLGYRASQWAVSTWQAAWLDKAEGSIAVVAVDGELVVSNQSGIDLDHAFLLYGGQLFPVGALPSGATARAGEPQTFQWSTVVNRVELPPKDLDDEEYYEASQVQDWRTSWDLLEEAFTEHVTRMGPLTDAWSVPMLLGTTTRGVAPPVPDTEDAVRQTFAIVRVPLAPAPFLETSK